MTDTAELTLTTLPLANLAAHPDNIRKRLGDLDELSKSIAGVGILEPLLVLPADDKGVHLVAAGNRRLAAAAKAGLAEAPCIVQRHVVRRPVSREEPRQVGLVLLHGAWRPSNRAHVCSPIGQRCGVPPGCHRANH
jgi:hypothetical protein